jgi:Cupin superfamily protein
MLQQHTEIIWNLCPPDSWTRFSEPLAKNDLGVASTANQWKLSKGILNHLTDDFSRLYQQVVQEERWMSLPGADVRMARAGAVVEKSAFSSLRTKKENRFSVPAATSIRSLFADGATLILEGTERHFAIPQALAFAASAKFRCSTQVNIYVTPPGSQGFDVHVDNHDVLAVQVSGRKEWRVGELLPLEDRPTRRHGYSRDWRSPDTVVSLEPGDMMYLPRGTVHCAYNASTEINVHMTLGLHWPVLGESLQGAVERMMKDGRLRSHTEGSDEELSMSELFTEAGFSNREALLKWVPHPIGPLWSGSVDKTQPVALTVPVVGINQSKGELWMSGINLQIPQASMDTAAQVIRSVAESGRFPNLSAPEARDIMDDLCAMGIVAATRN